jgi:hypothetical protein
MPTIATPFATSIIPETDTFVLSEEVCTLRIVELERTIEVPAERRLIEVLGDDFGQ